MSVQESGCAKLDKIQGGLQRGSQDLTKGELHFFLILRDQKSTLYTLYAKRLKKAYI